VGYADLETGDQYIFDNVVLELQRSLDYFERQFAQALPGKLLVYPPDRLSGEFILHVGSQINLVVEPLILEKMGGFTIDVDEDSQSSCLMAVGAALRELDGAPA
jgi:MSHA biogenesis protein MshI